MIRVLISKDTYYRKIFRKVFFLIEENLLSLGGTILDTLNLYPFSFKMENIKLKTFVKLKEMAENNEFIKIADESLKFSFINEKTD